MADSMDEALAAGNTTGTLFCIPLMLKDNYDTSNMITTGGNLALAGSQPSLDAPVVTALTRAGAIVLGKVNMHELALEGLSVSSLGGQTLNPYDFSRTPGGSSGGSGAAVSASFSVFGTGTDTVNSLRSPASANSLCSVRPTRGLIARTGIIPISYTQDAVGPIVRTIKDAAIVLTVMASTGCDTADNTTALIPASIRNKDYAISLSTGNLRGLRLGILNGLFNRTTSEETTPVNTNMDFIIARLQSVGVIVIPIDDIIYNTTAMLMSLDVQRFEYREGMDTYLSRPSLRGKHPTTLKDLYATSDFLVIPSQYEFTTAALVSSTANVTYETVQKDIHKLTLTLQKTFSSHNLDAVIYPEQQNLVVKVGSPSQSGRNGILGALTGSPVITLPVGFSPRTDQAPVGVPIGMEILGAPWSEQKLLQIAYQIEMLTKVRRMPLMADEVIEAKCYIEVPMIIPNQSNIPKEYPIGVI
ncbi:hypothetical protein MMC19_006360 [Ptychographa xylographoides]|nr:hypothetical protein [Ptychographa xylographoides]